jgi:hypothetical protein
MPPNGLAFSCRERAGEAFKMPTISRAKRSAAMPGWAAMQVRVLSSGCSSLMRTINSAYSLPMDLSLMMRDVAKPVSRLVVVLEMHAGSS